MTRTMTRTVTGLGILVLVALASVTAFVPAGVCEERRCVDERGDGEVPGSRVPGDDATEGDRASTASTAASPASPAGGQIAGVGDGVQPAASPASPAGDLYWTYDANRDLVESENEMINHRMVWFLTIQGLLFASFFIGWRGKGETREGKKIREKHVCIIYALGVFSAVSVGIVLFFGLNAIKCIVDNTPTVGEQYVIGLSHGPVPALIHYLLPWNSLPVLFVAAWHLLVEAETGDAGPKDPPS